MDQNRIELVSECLEAWAPDYPRRVGRQQAWADHPREVIEVAEREEERASGRPFISTYAFPRGHSKGGNIPKIDTLFIDFDFDEGEYERGSGDRAAWRRDMSHLLVRARRVAEVIAGSERTAAWRASLSGHKGIHLFLDFPALDPRMGSLNQYVEGVNSYAKTLVGELAAETCLDSLSDYVDVTSSDMGRLCRMPNTIHGGASESFGETRYCVPVSIDELEDMTPQKYESLTQEPRPPQHAARFPSKEAGDIISKYVQTVDAGGQTYYGGSSTVNWDRVGRYREQSNDNLELEDAYLLTSHRPCVWKFHEREDKFEYGNQSHEMESHSIAMLLEHNFPIDVIKEFFANAPQYDEAYTEQRIKELIARDFNPYSTAKLLERAPEFCGYEDCANCQRYLESQS